MAFLDYFRCCCCKKRVQVAVNPPSNPEPFKPTHRKGPTQVSYDFDNNKDIARSIKDLERRQPITQPIKIEVKPLNLKQLRHY